MIPNVFVSSTVQDLHHLRESVRDTIRELAFNPIMSEFGDIGYLPMHTAESSCYLSVQDCQLAVLIVGKRYGSISNNGLSVTHNEFRTIKEKRIPLIALVDEEVLSFKRVFDLNRPKLNSVDFPGMDSPVKSFELIQEIVDSAFNNGVIGISAAVQARERLKTQIAHIVCDLLRGRYDPIKAEIKDVLSEVRTLRHELLKENTSYLPFLRATRIILDDSNRAYSNLLKTVFPLVEEVIPLLLQSKTIADFFTAAGFEFKTESSEVLFHRRPGPGESAHGSVPDLRYLPPEKDDLMLVHVDPYKRIISMNEAAAVAWEGFLNSIHDQSKSKALTSISQISK